MFESVTVITGFDDVAVMGQAIQQSSRHFFIDEHTTPFREAQVGGDHDAGFFVELAANPFIAIAFWKRSTVCK